MTVTELYAYAEKNAVSVLEFDLLGSLSLALPSGHIALSREAVRAPSVEKTCLAHELGHCMTGSFYNADNRLDFRRRREERAERWAIKRLVPLDALRDALRRGVVEYWELAEQFGVTEGFMRACVRYYRDAAGVDWGV